ncbi:Ribosomal N-lysine methyltransferase set10 [Phytophthora cinnamomi]|uniref:Ribosomal N-lysine methyltransferase set10 n=1 Tax=Phytophthora cinnamomi TaxID=4785 RepID=UPI00355A95FC|nr:Ribosomal N-lysine methyltransferase set10 [Phytophthora cinnamomi]
MADEEIAPASTAELAGQKLFRSPCRAQGAQKPTVRGRYAKFNGTMDVTLLEALQINNPFTAKHGTRLQMWHNVAESVGMSLYKNPAAYSWHTCRDRVTALMKMYTDGKHDKLFKHGTMEENARKEAILREINDTLIRKNHKMAGQTVVDGNGKERVISTKSDGATFGSSLVAAPASTTLPQKRRKLESPMGAMAGKVPTASDTINSENFRARILELIESKIQFDMDQRQKETELREQEFELQKRFLEYLQSK